MLIKERDNHDSDVESLRSLLDCQISAKQRFLIEREIKCIGSGARGEDSSAYYIDFRYRDSPNCAIIHDLRLEHRGFVAQIDHLLINRLLDIYVLESKNYYYGIKITPEGEFLVWNGKTYVAIESPIEQNKRHIDLLRRVIEQPGFLPTRLGVSISPSFLSYVMVAPNSRVDRPAQGEVRYQHGDQSGWSRCRYRKENRQRIPSGCFFLPGKGSLPGDTGNLRSEIGSTSPSVENRLCGQVRCHGCRRHLPQYSSRQLA